MVIPGFGFEESLALVVRETIQSFISEANQPTVRLVSLYRLGNLPAFSSLHICVPFKLVIRSTSGRRINLSILCSLIFDMGHIVCSPG